jgi:uridylate kinase
LAYKRVLLKLTGEMFGDDTRAGINFDKVAVISSYIAHLRKEHKTDLAIVVGGGNLFRGRDFKADKDNRAMADYIGMMGTIMNGIALQIGLRMQGVESRVMSELQVKQACEPYYLLKARSHLDNGRVVILVGGKGSPFTTTDTAAASKAAELGCEILLKGSNVDGVYSADPKLDLNAEKFETLSFQEAIEKGLMVMDLTAFTVCKEQNIPVIVFDISDLENIERILNGEKIGTLIS